MPVSRTAKRSSRALVGVALRRDARRRPRPRSVNLTALPTRLMRTWRSRVGSPTTAAGTSGVDARRRARGPSRRRAWPTSSSAPLDARRAGRTACVSSSSLPASILEKSRMSLMMRQQRVAAVADGLGVARAARRRASVSSSRPVMPMTPFIGVRISWLMVARNALLASVAASALHQHFRAHSGSAPCRWRSRRTMRRHWPSGPAQGCRRLARTSRG